MFFRVAGAFGVDVATRDAFVREATAAFSPTGAGEVWTLQPEAPALTLVFGNPRRPALSRWRAPDGSCAVLDGDLFGLGGSAELRSENPAQALYREFGARRIETLKALRADAVSILYEAPLRRIMIARDKRGAAPFFYALLKQGFLFASDQSVLARFLPRTLDTGALDYFLARGYVPAPWTLLREMRKLPAAHLLEAREGEPVHVARYAWPTGQPKISPPREKRNQEIGALFAQSLRRRHPPGAQSAVLLSGGVDSALVLAGLVRLLGEKPDCYTFEYGDYSGEYNEGDAAARVARHFGVAHYRLACRPCELADNATSLVRAYGEPFTYGLHSFALERLAAGPSPIFTGIGSEPWGINRSGLVTLRFRRMPRPLRLLGRTGLVMAKLFAPERVARAHVLVWSDRTGLPPALAPTLLSDTQRRLLYLDPGLADAGIAASFDLLRAAAADFEGESELDQWRLLQDRSFGAEAVFAWNAAWARSYGLELRHPYLDDDLNAYMSRLTFSHQGKENQRDYAATLMPAEFARAPKVFQTIPIATWFRGPLRDFICATLESRRLEDVFDKAMIRHLLEQHLSGRADHAFALWGLASFAIWSEEVLHARPQEADPFCASAQSSPPQLSFAR